MCNFVYKVISKLLAYRHKPFCPDIISGNQGTIVKYRDISDNIGLAHELIIKSHKLTKKWKELIALKLDKTKAYDRVKRFLWKF